MVYLICSGSWIDSEFSFENACTGNLPSHFAQERAFRPVPALAVSNRHCSRFCLFEKLVSPIRRKRSINMCSSSERLISQLLGRNTFQDLHVLWIQEANGAATWFVSTHLARHSCC
jgi:hypothetical protein